MTEPRAAEGILQLSGGNQLLDDAAQRVADLVDRIDLLDADATS